MPPWRARVAEILVRLPPADPACLLRASLVCKPWLHLSGRAFRRRYGAFHRAGEAAPPMLGVLGNVFDAAAFSFRMRFLRTTSSFRPRAGADLGEAVMDCRHGRALLCGLSRSHTHTLQETLAVWDPMTGDLHRLREPAGIPRRCSVPQTPPPAAAATTSTATGAPSSSSSSAPTRGSRPHRRASTRRSPAPGASPPPSTTSATASASTPWGGERGAGGILRYDIAGHRLSAIDLPEPYGISSSVTIMRAESGAVVLAGVRGCMLHLWSTEEAPAPAGAAARPPVQTRVVDLRTMIPLTYPLPVPPYRPLRLMGAADGTNTLFVRAGTAFVEGAKIIVEEGDAAYYTIDLKSMRASEFHADGDFSWVYPYMAFYLPGAAQEVNCH
ncbi:hypothetical protein ACP4OV_012095 [Aristida adscensionis]